MAEGDTILRAAHRLEAALAGRRVAVSTPNPRGRAARVDRLDGSTFEGASAIGKNLLLDFGELTLHSHLGMSGSWHTYRHGERWRKPRRSAWLVLAAEQAEAVQFGGPTMRLLRSEAVSRDPQLVRLGPDILAPGFTAAAGAESLRGADQTRGLGDALLDQGRIAGIGNIFKSEGCWAAHIDPWRALGEVGDDELEEVVGATAALMSAAVAQGRRPKRVYRRAGAPCRRCGRPIRSRGQGDANRTTYWCAHCQS